MNDTQATARALTGWGLPAAVRATRLGAGLANQHWRVDVPGAGPLAGPLVLRHYHRRRPPAAIRYEHQLLRVLAERQWPVAAPLATPAADTIVETEDGRWSLFPLLTGSPPPHEPLYQQRRGAVLALLHEDMAEWIPPGQRPAFGRVTELDVPVQAYGFESFVALVAAFAERDPERAAALSAFRTRNMDALARLGFDRERGTVTYGGCLRVNVLFEDGDVTGLLDFDLAHEDVRIADVARSLLCDCWPAGRHLHSWMAGYAAHAAPRLRSEEVDLIPALMIAHELWNAVVALAIASREDPHELSDAVRRSIDERLPALEATQAESRQVARAGAGFPS